MSDLRVYEARRERLRQRYLPDGEPSGGSPYTGGVDHLALICSDMEATIGFYTEVLRMRLNRIDPALRENP